MTRDEFAAEALKALVLAEATNPGPQNAGPPAPGEKRGDAALVARAYAFADEMVKQSVCSEGPTGLCGNCGERRSSALVRCGLCGHSTGGLP